MPLEEKHEGLVLRSIDYKDRQKIITLFTPTRGMISLFVKGITRKKTHLLTLTSPFTQGEYLFTVRNSDLYAFRDGSPMNTHHNLRENFAHLSAAGALAQALLSSQMPGKPAPSLYQLTLAYLKHLPAFEDPTALISSYLLKLLKHEGHVSLTHRESAFSSDEWAILTALSQARRMDQIKETPVSLHLHQKIQIFFNEKI